LFEEYPLKGTYLGAALLAVAFAAATIGIPTAPEPVRTGVAADAQRDPSTGLPTGKRQH
jgi:hypothetical protein